MQLSKGSEFKGYKIKDYINQGGFGHVYSAYQPAIKRDVAIKVILPQYANTPNFIQRFETEAQVIARLEHPYIVPLYDFWRNPNGAYLVMRLLKGGSLKDVLQQQGALSVEETMTLLEQISQALQIAHQSQIIHRDIKPGNILMDEHGNAYLADFGIAKDRALSSDVTDPDGIVGSPDYLAPEQATSEPVTPRTDIYSLGVVIYEMLVGEHPFPNANSVERLFKHLNEPLPDIWLKDNDNSSEINDVIQKATSKNPAERYADVHSLAQAFREATGLDHTSQPVTLVELLTPREREVLQMIVEGKKNREIADALFVDITTVKSHVNSIYRKLSVKRRGQAIARAQELGLLANDTEIQASFEVSNLPEPVNPYKGLLAFQAVDSHRFFGREKLTQKLLLRLQEDVEYRRFLAIVGPSGSGKSSVAKAGLLAALNRGDLPKSEDWYRVDMIPGAHPLDELEVALTRVLPDSKINLHEQLERDERGLIRIADMILPDDGRELLLLIDQFEEVFTLVESEERRLHFLNLLHEAITAPRSRVRVVVTLRADYYDKPLQYPEFGELIRARLETILPLSVEELERAIREPAKSVGVTFEDGLVSRMVSDVHYQPGALPLLQYALTELFEYRENRLLTLEAYQKIGGTGGALANRADEIFNEYDDDDQQLIRQMFLRLVTLGEGAEDTRRRANRAELLAITDHNEAMEDIIDTYANSRLLSLDHDPATRHPTVEVAHEAILREWDRLRQWLNDSREDIRQEREIARIAQQWQDSGNNSDFLLRGSRLEQAEQWHDSTELALTPLESEFIQASVESTQAQEHAEAERQAREQEQEERAQALTQRSLRLLQGLVAVLAIGLLVAAGLAVIANNERNNAILAQEETVAALDIAQRNSLAQAATIALQREEYDLATSLAVESAKDGEPLPETVRILDMVADAAGPMHVIDTGGNQCSWNWSKDGRYATITNCSDTAYVYDLMTGEPVNSYPGSWLEFSRDNQRVMTQIEAECDTPESECTTIAIYEMETGELVSQISLEEEIDFWDSGWDSSTIVIAHGSNEKPPSDLCIGMPVSDTVTIRDIYTGDTLKEYKFEGIQIANVALSNDGQIGVVGGNRENFQDSLAIVFDVDTGETLQTIERKSGFCAASAALPIAISDDATKLWMGGHPNYLIDLTTGEDIRTFKGNRRAWRISNDFTHMTYEKDGFQIQNLETGEVQKLPFIRDWTQRPVIGWNNDIWIMNTVIGIQVWDLKGRNGDAVIINDTSPYAIAKFNPHGTSILSSSSDPSQGRYDNYQIWDIEQGETTLYQPGYELPSDTIQLEDIAKRNTISALGWSTDGKYFAIRQTTPVNDLGQLLQETSPIVVFDATTGDPVIELEGLVGKSNEVIYFTADNQYVLSGHGSHLLYDFFDNDDAPILYKWDIETGEIVYQLEFPIEGRNKGISDIDVLPDNKTAIITIWTDWFTTFHYQVDIQNGVIEGELDGGSDILASTIHPNMVTVIESTLDGPIRVRNLESGEIIRQWDALDVDTGVIAVSPDGKLIATGSSINSSEASISLWDYETGQLIRRYLGYDALAFIGVLEFSPDGQYLLSTGRNDGKVILWDVDDQPTLDWILENRYIREFTCQERELYRIEPLCEVEE